MGGAPLNRTIVVTVVPTLHEIAEAFSVLDATEQAEVLGAIAATFNTWSTLGADTQRFRIAEAIDKRPDAAEIRNWVAQLHGFLSDHEKRDAVPQLPPEAHAHEVVGSGG